MTLVGLLSPALAGVALGTGLYAAYKWYLASAVPVDFGYTSPSDPPGATYRRMGMEFPRFPEPADPDVQQMYQSGAMLDALTEAATINKAAAIWTAVSVTASAASALAGSLLPSGGTGTGGSGLLWWLVLTWLGLPAGVLAAAGFLARRIAGNAVDAHFKRAEAKLKHEHDASLEAIRATYARENARDVENLKGQINTSLSRIARLHQFEFDTLPEAWRRVQVAVGDAHQFLSYGIVRSPDFSTMSRDQIMDYGVKQGWESEDRLYLVNAQDKMHAYFRIKEHYDLMTALNSHGEAHNYLSERGVFIEQQLREKLRGLLMDIHHAIIERRAWMDIKGQTGGMTSEEIESANAKSKALIAGMPARFKELEDAVEARLWVNQTR